MDSSKSMFRQSGNGVELLVSEILKSELDFQDRFHLISFADEAELEQSVTLRDKKSIEDVLARVMLLPPLEEGTDIISALRYLVDYIGDLPLQSRKQILIFSDDIHQPASSSDYLDREENLSRIEAIASYIKRNGWNTNIVTLPASEPQEDAFFQTGLLAYLGEQLRIELSVFDQTSRENFADALVKGESNDELAIISTGPAADDDDDEASNEMRSGRNEEETSEQGSRGSFFDKRTALYLILFLLLFVLIFLLVRRLFSSGEYSATASSVADRESSSGLSLSQRESETPRSMDLGQRGLSTDILGEAKKRRGERELAYGERQSADIHAATKTATNRKKEEPKAAAKGSTGEGGKSASTLAAFAAHRRERREGGSYGLTLAKDSSAPKPTHQRNTEPLKGQPGQDAIEMKVDFQWNRLGRNMKWFDKETSYSIGQAGVADFEIRSVDVEGVIASIRRRDESYLFTPEQPEYFPELKKPIENCLGRTIRVVSPDSGFSTSLLFHRWRSPLDRLNRLLHMTDSPGKPDPDI